MRRIKGHIQAQKTVILRAKIESDYKDELYKYIVSTKALYADTTQFFAKLFLDNLPLLNTKADDLFHVVENLTVISKQRPSPQTPLRINMPQDMRRSCIRKAFGTVKSWYSNYRRWQLRKEKHEAIQAKKLKGANSNVSEYVPKKFTERPPVPAEDFGHLNPIFYSGMYKEFDGDSIILKLWTGQAWVFMKQPIQLKGRELPSGYEWGSPTLVLKDKLHLHVPVIKQVKSNGQLAEQAKNPDGLTICSVDLNLDGDLAVATILHSDVTGSCTETATLFVKGNDAIQHRRKRELGKIAVASSKTNKGFGIDKKGDNVNRFRKIKHRDDYEYHRISRRIADFANKHGATVIVFECLTNLRPDRTKYSRRSNQKRAYWLKSKIINRTKYKAFQSYGIITALVSPKNTSKHCALCNGNFEDDEDDSLVSRIEAQFSTNVAKLFQKVMNKSLEKVDYNAGAPNYICSYTISHRGNADLNAARNIGKKFFTRYYQKPRLKVEKQGLSATHAARKASGLVAGKG